MMPDPRSAPPDLEPPERHDLAAEAPPDASFDPGVQTAPPHRGSGFAPRGPSRAEPLAPPLEGGRLDLDAGLELFGHEQFRPGQREAIATLVEDKRLLLVAPTGGGKSLTYQLPAALMPGTTLVISPLIALMHDQVESLHACGIPATFLASTLGGEPRSFTPCRARGGP